MSQAYQSLVLEGGVRSMFKGVYPTLLRAYIVNMVTLPLYDVLKDKLDGYYRE